MNKIIILLIILLILLLTSCYGSIDSDVNHEEQYEDPILEEARPYLNEIVVDDIELRTLAASITKGCISGDKECQLNKIYRYVVEEYSYYSDPRDVELIQSPFETIQIQGGDCEDMSILISSLLENLGFKTYLVLTEDHAYSLACGINTDDLWIYVEEGMIEKAKDDLNKEKLETDIIDGQLFFKDTYVERLALNSGEVWYYGGEGDAFNNSYMNIKYDLKSTKPLDVYFIAHKEDYYSFLDGDTFRHYLDCAKENVYESTDSCNYFETNGGIILFNPGSDAKVDIQIESYYAIASSDFISEEDKITYYEIDGEECVVLETTAGEYGFTGYDSNEGNKTAIDPITEEIIYLD